MSGLEFEEFPGFVEWLSDGANEFPVFVLSTDTDMPTLGVGCLTSAIANEIALAPLEVAELKGDTALQILFVERINKLLGRNDMKVVALLRVDGDSCPEGLSFQAWMANRKPPQPIHGSIFHAGAESRIATTLTVSEYQSRGGVITRVTAA